MIPLSGLDATFLYTETPTVLMHTLKIGVVNLSGIPVAAVFDQFRSVLAAHLHLLPLYRHRLAERALALGHPVWVPDPDFNLDLHLRRVSVAAPGDQRQLETVIADICAQPLPRNRPLWEITMIDGFADRTVAFVGKVHHAVADGLASSRLLANLLHDDPGALEPSRPAEPWQPPAPPTSWGLLGNGLTRVPAKLARLPGLTARTVGGLARSWSQGRRRQVKAAKPFQGPRTPFNRTLGPTRAFAAAVVPFAPFHRVKTALGVTVNDVLLAVVGGAVKSYLSGRGVVLSRPLVAAVPMGAENDRDADRILGNRLSNMMVSLCTDVDDPRQRVLAVHHAAAAAKEAHRALGADLMAEWAEYTPRRAFSLGFRALSAMKVANHVPSAVNLIVSNVRGPAKPLYIAGIELQRFFSVGPILDALGLNVTAWSYRDHVSFSVLADGRALPDPQELARRFGEEVQRLDEQIAAKPDAAS